MTSVYDVYLPRAFPYLVVASQDTVRFLARRLLEEDRKDNLTDGSSFAVSVVDPDNWSLWLSKVSYDYIQTVIEPYLQVIDIRYDGPSRMVRE